ncbi:MAG: MgtC/SapB family protein [Bacillota bacterium]|nr:MgtC/SapB family protein [Bacillota bacterium]
MDYQEFVQMMQELNTASITVRLLLAVLFGGVVGLERGSNKHQAGLRTHILVCVGATVSMLTSQYIFETMSTVADPARLGAQVISGIGFLGAGLILVTARNKVKGLTTAAGLWASACIGLALGIGFYQGALIAAVLVFIVLALLPKVEDYFYNRSKVVDLFVELESLEDLKAFLSHARSVSHKVLETQVSRSNAITPEGYGLIISLRLSKGRDHAWLVEELSRQPGVFQVEEY